MARLRSLAPSMVYRSLMLLPEAVVMSVEEKARLVQGKGGGADSVTQEVHAALSLLPAEKRQMPVVFDVGANVGDWSQALLACAPSATLVCFEPSETAFRSLRNRFLGMPNVQLEHKAIGREPGSAQLWADHSGSGLASLTRRRLDHFGTDFSHSETVEVVTLQGWVNLHNLQPDIVKLDIEGHELDALRGGVDVVMRSCVVQFEFGGCNIDTRTFFQDFFYFFREHDFEVLRLSPKGLVPIDHYRELDEAFATSNFFAVSRGQQRAADRSTATFDM